MICSANWFPFPYELQPGRRQGLPLLNAGVWLRRLCQMSQCASRLAAFAAQRPALAECLNNCLAVAARGSCSAFLVALWLRPLGVPAQPSSAFTAKCLASAFLATQIRPLGDGRGC